MNYTHSITSKGQITIPKEFRDRLRLDKAATISFADDKIILTQPKTLNDVRMILNKPSNKDSVSDKESIIGKQLAKHYGVR